MKKKTKYMMSGGLAFSEKSDMKKLSKKSLQGWHLKKFSFMGYGLEKGEPSEVIYTIDYHLVEENDKEEYFELFEMAGWAHVCSEYNMHIFKAPKETEPIYTDKITTIEKYNRLRKPLQKWAISITLLLLVFIMLTTLTIGIVKEISVIGLYIMIVLFVPSIMTFIAAFTRQLKSTRRGEL